MNELMGASPGIHRPNCTQYPLTSDSKPKVPEPGLAYTHRGRGICGEGPIALGDCVVEVKGTIAALPVTVICLPLRLGEI